MPIYHSLSPYSKRLMSAKMAKTHLRRPNTVEFGFSWAGVAFLAMLFVPNILWARNQPPGYRELACSESGALAILERIGEVAACVTVLIFTSPCGYEMPWFIWAVAALILMLLYEVAWARYFKTREVAAMYQPLGPIPVPLATLPVAALLLLGVWQLSPYTVAAAVILGIGHIGIHLAHRRQLQR